MSVQAIIGKETQVNRNLATSQKFFPKEEAGNH